MPRLIDADALMRDIDKDLFNTESRKCYEKMRVRRQPAIDAELVRHGRWKGKKWFYSCSICGGLSPEDGGVKTNYCPDCGAKMDLEVRDDENSEERQAARNTEELL